VVSTTRVPTAVDDALLAEAAERFGTPAYVYDLREPTRRYRALREPLPSRVRICFALKANGHPAIVSRLAAAGCGADVSSEGELAAAEYAGISAADTVFTGPAKTPGVLASLRRRSVGLVVVESVHEARRLARPGREQAVLVRVNPVRDVIGEGIAIGAPSSRFGIDEERAAEAITEIEALAGISVVGIHANRASNVLSADAWLAGARDTVAIARGLGPLGIVDLGGGAGIAYAGEEPFDVRRFTEGLTALAAEGFGLILELGRWLVAEAGWYLTRVLDVKSSRGEVWVVTDGGIHHLYRPLLPAANRELRIVNGDDRPMRRVNVAGCLSTPSDVFATAIDLSDPAPGDVIAVPRCGAYGRSHSLQPFAMHPPPAEICFDGDDLRVT
jgi:diaminopimelate decarboxylase